MKRILFAAVVAVIKASSVASVFSGAPDGYTRLAYLESSGAQYIDTGVTMSADSGFSIVYRVVAPVSNQAVCGSRTDSGDTRCMVGSNYAHFRDYIDTVAYVGWGAMVVPTQKQIEDVGIGTVRINYLNSGKVVCRGVSADLSNLPTQDKTFYLFAANAHDGILYGSSRIYDVRISSGSVCVRHYIPVRRDSDSALGLYDTVNEGFLQNGGSGAFIAGPAVDDSSYERLDYLESSGTQYVDTGVLFTDRHGYSLTWQEVKDEANSNVCGSRNTSGDTRCVTGANHEKVYIGWNELAVSSDQWILTTTEGTAQVNYLNSRKVVVRGHQADLTTLEPQTVSFYLFGAHYGYQGDIFSSSRIMSFEMTYDDKVVMSLVPARRKTDGVVGFYDELNGDFYLNESATALIEPARVLPEGYARISYVESTGTQYINTGVKDSSNVEVEISVYEAYANSVQIFGARKAFQNEALSLSFQSESGSQGFRTCWGNDKIDRLIVADSLGVGDGFHVFSFGGGRCPRIDGAYSVECFSSQEFANSLDLFAFGLNNNGTLHPQSSSVRIASLRLYDGGELVRDFVPMLSLSDFKPGLYDRQNGVFYGNEGTGAFLGGPVVEGMEGGDILADKEIGTIALDGATAQEVDFDCSKLLGLYRLVFQCRKTGADVSTVSVQLDGRTLGATVTPSGSGSVTANFDVKLPQGAHKLSFAGTSAAELSEVSLYLLREKLKTGLIVVLQ